MIMAYKEKNLKLMHIEELCFDTEHERIRNHVEKGTVSDIYMLKRPEKHNGHYSRLFYTKELAGGVIMGRAVMPLSVSDE